jgi:NAD(P) transhydrogenase
MATDPIDVVARAKEKYDLLVLGSGPAGIAAAFQSSKLGKKVAIIEKTPSRIGGAWIHTGTIPSKTLREVCASIHGIRSHVGDHWVERLVNNLSSTRLIGRASEVCREEEELIRRHLSNNNITIFEGLGRIEDRNSIRVVPAAAEPYLIKAEHILIATGSRPRRPLSFPFDGWRVVDSDEILRIENIPRRILIFGAGVIGCEYACIFGALGVETVIVDARSRIMQSVDLEIAEALKKSMEDLGIHFKMGAQLKHLDVSGPHPIADFGDEKISTDVFFFAAGRESVTQHIGLDRVGIGLNDRGAIVVNDYFQTVVPNIYAAGDVIGAPALAATSTEQGRCAASHAFGAKRKFPKVYPVGVYTIPELSTVGKTEEECKEEGIDYVVGRSSYSEVARGYIRGDSHGLLKIIADRKTLQIIGLHILGSDACNLIHIGQVVMLSGMHLNGMINSVIFNYPTLAEAYRVAAFNALNKVFPGGVFQDPETDVDMVAA